MWLQFGSNHMPTTREIIYRETVSASGPVKAYNTALYRNWVIAHVGLQDQELWLRDRDLDMVMENVRCKHLHAYRLVTTFYVELTAEQHVEYVMTWG